MVSQTHRDSVKKAVDLHPLERSNLKDTPNNIVKVIESLKLRTVKDVRDLADKGYFRIPKNSPGLLSVADRLGKVLLKNLIDHRTRNLKPKLKAIVMQPFEKVKEEPKTSKPQTSKQAEPSARQQRPPVNPPSNPPTNSPNARTQPPSTGSPPPKRRPTTDPQPAPLYTPFAPSGGIATGLAWVPTTSSSSTTPSDATATRKTPSVQRVPSAPQSQAASKQPNRPQPPASRPAGPQPVAARLAGAQSATTRPTGPQQAASRQAGPLSATTKSV